MAAQNSSGLNLPRDAAAESRENSYEKSLIQAPDIQQPGEAGDFGNGAATGRTKPSRKKSKSIVEGAAGSPRLPNVSDDAAPGNGAEPSNPYSGT